jgi:hypothetical protein
VRPALAMIVLALAAGASRADSGFYWPGTGSALTGHRIETIEEYPDHVFVVERSRPGPNREGAEYAELAPGKPITIPPAYPGNATLLIVPRVAAEPYKSAPELTKAVYSQHVPAVILRDFYGRETVPVWTGREITITYRLQRTDSGDGWEIVRTSWSPMWQWYAAAIFLTVAVIFGGWRVVRRWRRSNASATVALDPPACG